MESKFGDKKYDVTVYDSAISRDGFSEDGKITSGCLVFVYDAGTKTLATIYGGPQRETLANPISRSQFATDDKISFYAAGSSYDIVVNDDKGNTGSYPGVTPLVHSVNLDRSGSEKCLVFPVVFNAGGTEVDTGLDLLYGAMVHDAAVEVVTADATETLNIGLLSSETAGDADGFIAGISVASTGFVQPVAYTTGSNEVYLSGNTYGVLIAAGSLGNDVATDAGSLAKKGHYVTGTNAVSISYQPSSSDTLAGYGYVMFRIVR